MQLDFNKLEEIILNALSEDIGQGDITSELVIPDSANITANFVAREDCVVCGIPILEQVFSRYNDVRFQPSVQEGRKLKAGSIIFKVSGNARAILKTERVALNLMQYLSGIATETSKFAEKISHTSARILDTRKTLPGYRMLSKYAVWVGGGNNHRFCLDDGILIKDNHIALAGNIREAVLKAKAGNTGLKVEVECDNLLQVEEAINAEADIILLDNMDIETLKRSVALRGQKNTMLEASGGVNLDNVKGIAETGVDYISVGRLTHSVKAIDIGLDVAT